MKTITENRIKNIPGFVRVPEFDFVDDGTHFTMWAFKGMPISQARSCGMTFLAIRPDYIKTFAKNGYSKLTHEAPFEIWKQNPAYRLADKFNGVDEFEMEDLIDTINKVIRGIKEAEDTYNSVSVDTEPVATRTLLEIENTEVFLKDVVSKYNWIKASISDVSEFKNAYCSIERQLNFLKTFYKGLKENKCSKADIIRKSGQLRSEGYVQFRFEESDESFRQDYWFVVINKLIAKQTAA